MSYVMGLDIGVASCGWAVVDLEKQRIIDLGIRIFEKAENQKTGQSLNEPRRIARGQRRRLQRRANRLKQIRELFLSEKLFESKEQMDAYFDGIREFDQSVWDLRVAGLSSLLEPGEWARVLIRISKRRGYQSNRRLDNIQQDAEKTASEKQESLGVVASGIQLLEQHKLEGGYRTIGETLAKHEAYQEFKRNRHSVHRFHIDRSMLIDEISQLFEEQRRLGSQFASLEFEKAYKKLAFSQLPYATKELLLKKVGFCTFEKEEKRAPKHSRSAELFNLLQKVNHLRLVEGGVSRGLTDEQREILIQLAHKQQEIKYSTVRKELGMSDDVRFSGLNYPREEQEKKKTENAKFIGLKFYHTIRKSLLEAGEEELWHHLENDRAMFDKIGEELTLCKNENELLENLAPLELPHAAVQSLASLSFSGYAHLSCKAYDAIIPHLEEGLTYDKACEAAGYDFRDQTKSKYPLLPVIPQDDVRNPVVFRALTQARKVLNAIIRQYGTPGEVHIEVARELSKSFEERNKIKKTIEGNRADKERLALRLKELFPIFKHKDPKPFDLLKFRLCEEQSGQCAYSGKHIDPNRLFDNGYVEVDHILPMSRTMDDSYLNKVLVLQAENRNKRNQTPHEWLRGDTEKWEQLMARIKVLPYKKQQNMMRKSLNEEQKREFLQRNLNDTRYIARYFSNFVRDHLEIASGKVICVNGQLTSFLRTRYGLGHLKNRSEDVHHALDALIVAIANEATIKRVSDFHKRGELALVNQTEKVIDPETGEIIDEQYLHADLRERFPLPWSDFRNEVLCRFGIDPRDNNDERVHDPVELVKSMSLSAYVGLKEVEWKSVRPIFVSRAPRRKVTGRAHQDTIKGLRKQGEAEVKVKKVSLATLVGTKKKFTEDEAIKAVKEIYGEDPNLRDSLMKWLVESDNLQESIKNGDFPRKQAKNGVGPQIKSVKLIEKSTAGVRLHNGRAIAENDSMVRVDIFEKNGKYYGIPIYVADTVKSELPNKAATAGKEEKDWDVMDDTFNFKFSLYKNDLVEIRKDKLELVGYFDGFHRSTAAINILFHDRSIGKNGVIEGIGIKTSVKEFNKLFVDILGNYYYIKGEKRLGFSKRSHK